MAVDKRTLNTDPERNIRRIFRYDPLDESFLIETVSDVEPVLEENKAIYNQVDEKARWKGGVHRVASIPASVWADLKRRGITKDEARLRRWLDDPENRFFRTRPGRLHRPK